MDSNSAGAAGFALFVLAGLVAAAVLLFLIFRQIVLWYWRVTESVELLREIRDELRRSRTLPPVPPNPLQAARRGDSVQL